MGVRWLYSCFFVGCCFQDLFKITRSNLVQFPSSLFSMRFVSVHVVHPYSSTDTTAARKKSCFSLSDRSENHTIDCLSIAVHAFAWRILTSLSVDEILLLKYVNLSTNFRRPAFRVEIAPSHLKHMYSVLFTFTWRPMPLAACSRLCSKDSVWVGVFAISTISSA